MTNEELAIIIKTRKDKLTATLCAKAEEYARGGDRLSNFKVISAFMNITPEKALLGLIAKHLVAIVDFINDIDGGVLQNYERWDEKIGDIIAYMCLLDALICERKNNE